MGPDKRALNDTNTIANTEKQNGKKEGSLQNSAQKI